jgi:hypothetical protein
MHALVLEDAEVTLDPRGRKFRAEELAAIPDFAAPLASFFEKISETQYGVH